MSDRLVEEVARRLWDAAGDNEPRVPWDKLVLASKREQWLRMAREAIRFAEWARRECHGHYFSMGASGGCDLDPSSELITYPPDDWRNDE